jgi:hypothetical protein
MRVESVSANAHKRCFEVALPDRASDFPYVKCDPRPSGGDPVASVAVDPEIGNEGFTYLLRSGAEGTVHVDQVLEYNRDPGYLRDALVYDLTLQAQSRVETSGLSKREVIRRLGTSATQLYRLLDQTNTTKTVDQMLRLLSVLDCDVRVEVVARGA